jgi:aspartate/methionine/tyrosine aminotransferase
MLCKRLIEEESTFLVPGDCFEMHQYVRIGYGNSVDVLVEGLRNLKSFLDRNR